jgi:hypothetical protein
VALPRPSGGRRGAYEELATHIERAGVGVAVDVAFLGPNGILDAALIRRAAFERAPSRAGPNDIGERNLLSAPEGHVAGRASGSWLGGSEGAEALR